MLLSVFLLLQIAVEVEDDFPEGIVQAEEEEEEQLEAGVAFSGGAEAVFRSRERVPRMSAFRDSVDSTSHTNRTKKRKLDGTILSGQSHNWLVVLNSSLQPCIFNKHFISAFVVNLELSFCALKNCFLLT